MARFLINNINKIVSYFLRYIVRAFNIFQVYQYILHLVF